MGPRCSSAETQVCHRSYIIAARSDGYSSKYVVVLEHCLSPEDDSMLGQMVTLVSMLLY